LRRGYRAHKKGRRDRVGGWIVGRGVVEQFVRSRATTINPREEPSHVQ